MAANRITPITNLVGDLDTYADELDGEGSHNAANGCRAAITRIAQLEEALINAQSLLRAFGGDLTKYPKSEADAGRIDAVMWTAQDQIRSVLAKAEGRS